MAKTAHKSVHCGATSGFDAHMDIRLLWNKQQSYLGSHYGTAAELSDALQFVKRGLIRPVVMTTLPLEDVAQSHDLLEHDAAVGKIVLVP